MELGRILPHMMNASFLTCAFLISGISAWRILQRVDGPATKLVLKTGLYLALFLAPLQVVIGDLYGLNVLEHQPAKIAAIEGVWHTEKGADFTILGIPDEKQQKTHFALTIPNMASWILTHDFDGEVKGIDEFGGKHPPVAMVFWSFRVMVGIGVLMILVAGWGAWTLIFKKRNLSPLQLKIFSWMTFSGWIASLAGWYVTEIGRQPFIVYGHINAAEVVADHPSENVAVTLFSYILIYSFLLISYIGSLRYLSSKPAASLKLVQEYAT